MALKGNLRDFTITQLLNLINLANKTGSLMVEGSNQAIEIFFRDGKLAYAQLGHEDNSLVGILHKTNRLSKAQYRTIKEHASSMSDKELGLLLINGNYFTQQDILTSLQAYFVSVLNCLFTWVEGFFRFETDVIPPEDKITVRVNLENIILEGARHLKEWEQLQDEIPSLDMALKFTDRPGTNIRNVTLSKQEWRVISYINPKNSMRQIANAIHLNDLEIRRIVYGLLQAGLVEIVKPLRAPLSPVLQNQLPVSIPPVNKDERKSLINRLIDRIRSL